MKEFIKNMKFVWKYAKSEKKKIIVYFLLSVFGLANMWFAVFADTGVTLLTILNSLKIMKKFNSQ